MVLASRPHQRTPLWRDERVLSLLGQAVFVAIVVLVGAFLYGNVRAALERQELFQSRGRAVRSLVSHAAHRAAPRR